jgi:hypothetical protein
VIFEVLKAMPMKKTVSCDVTPYSVVDWYTIMDAPAASIFKTEE